MRLFLVRGCKTSHFDVRKAIRGNTRVHVHDGFYDITQLNAPIFMVVGVLGGKRMVSYEDGQHFRGAHFPSDPKRGFDHTTASKSKSHTHTDPPKHGAKCMYIYVSSNIIRSTRQCSSSSSRGGGS